MRRREFIGQALGFGAAFRVLAVDAAERTEMYGKERMRLGVLSDIHVATEEQLPYVEMALRFFDRWKADAILACGDLTDYGLEVELKLLADTWFKVFPDGFILFKAQVQPHPYTASLAAPNKPRFSSVRL